MKIIIPMSGFGERFRKVGYKVPKPLINVDGIHMIGHVVNLFPGEKDFIFICNEDHLLDENYRMKEIIKSYCPTGKIVSIKPHKLGPVHAVLEVSNLIDLNEKVIVNYCDFSCYWNWDHFKQFISNTNVDGAIPAYKGFHPHSLGKTNYAYMKQEEGLLTDIQEKKPFTKNRINEYASSGTYYFSSGSLLLESFTAIKDKNHSINGEFYVSLAYKELLNRDKNIAVYPLKYFFQWGTPDDLEEYLFWSKTFRSFINKNKPDMKEKGSLIVPMAGRGKRFRDEGYLTPKPLIEIQNKPMVLRSVETLPKSLNKVFVIREDMEGINIISSMIKKDYPESNIKLLKEITEGQAISSLLGLEELDNTTDLSPLTIASCDSGYIFDNQKFQQLLNRKNVDVIIWATRNHANAKRNPEMFGWIDSDEKGQIREVSVKKPINNDLSKFLITGTFTFNDVNHFKKAVESCIDKGEKINGEFYLDSCINECILLGYGCYVFEVDAYISWGTPNDLKTFQYWQSAFNKWAYHPYKL